MREFSNWSSPGASGSRSPTPGQAGLSIRWVVPGQAGAPSTILRELRRADLPRALLRSIAWDPGRPAARLLPKGTELIVHSPDHLGSVENELNTGPR